MASDEEWTDVASYFGPVFSKWSDGRRLLCSQSEISLVCARFVRQPPDFRSTDRVGAPSIWPRLAFMAAVWMAVQRHRTGAPHRDTARGYRTGIPHREYRTGNTANLMASETVSWIYSEPVGVRAASAARNSLTEA